MLAQALSLAKKTKIQVGDMHWQVQNLHVYERHFKLVQA
jgi:thymidylate synthase